MDCLRSFSLLLLFSSSFLFFVVVVLSVEITLGRCGAESTHFCSPVRGVVSCSEAIEEEFHLWEQQHTTSVRVLKRETGCCSIFVETFFTFKRFLEEKKERETESWERERERVWTLYSGCSWWICLIVSSFITSLLL